jgi:purine catabolism regulator
MAEVANDPAPGGESLPTPGAGQPALDAVALRGVPVRQVLSSEALRGTEVLAGGGGLKRPVTRINVMEVPDIEAWVRPGELLLTTGYAVRSRPQRLIELIAELDERGVAALGIKLGRYVDEMPAEALAAADRRGFPILSLPEQVSFDDVLTEVLTELVNRQARALARAEEVHRQLLAIVLGGGGLPELATGTAKALDAAIIVTAPDGRPLAEAGSEADLAAVRAGSWTDSTGRLRIEDPICALGLHEGPEDEGGGHAVASVAAGSLDHGRIAAFCRSRRLGDEDLQALERAATAAALVVTRELAVAAVEGKYRSDFLRDVLLGRAGEPPQVARHAAGLGWDLDRPLVVLVLEPDDDPSDTRGPGTSTALRPLVERQATALGVAVSSRDPRAAVAGYSTEAVALVGVPGDGDVARLVRDLVASVRGEGGGGRRPFSLGVSRVCSGVADIAHGYEQARTAVRVGRQVSGPASVSHFNGLGVYRLLSLVQDPAELRAFAAETLKELAGEGEEAEDLRRTLEALLDTNLNVAETARRLHFHYNTLRYRITKLERLLGPFTEDATLRLNLALALRVVAMRGIG